MNKSLNYLFLIIILSIFLYGITYFKAPQQSTQKVLSSTPSMTLTISPNPNAKCHAKYIGSDPEAVLPDPNCTPGSVNINVTQANIDSTICQSGFTKTIRPSSTYTNNLKIQQISEYGYADIKLKDYEEDHLISLELGGSPDDPKNLWPEPGFSPNEKDRVENYLKTKVCNKEIPLSQAQDIISQNWYQYFLQLPK